MIPIQFVMNSFNTNVLGHFCVESDGIEYIQIFIDAIGMYYNSDIDNLILAVSNTIEHEVWHFILNKEGLDINTQHKVIDILMKDKPKERFRDDFITNLKRKEEEIDRSMQIAYG